MINRNSRIAKFRNELLKKPTVYELLFMQRLKDNNIKFMFQKGFIAGNYSCIVDFYLPKPKKICIEIDGEYHEQDAQKIRDAVKDRYLTMRRKFKVIRIKNEEVETFDLSVLKH